MARNASRSGDVVGVVKGINGLVTAVKSDGTTRTLHQGDAVFKDEVIKSSNGATVHIDFNQGGFATLGSGQSLPLDGSMLSNAASAAKPDTAAPATEAAPEDVAKQQELIAEAIARGEDPTALLEAAAAGAAGGAGGGNEGSSFVVVQQNAARGDVTPGFETNTFSTPLNDVNEYRGAFLVGLNISLSAYSVSESDEGFNLILDLDRPATNTITITFDVSGNASILQAIGAANEYRSDISIGNGVSYTYDPATHQLTVTIPSGTAHIEIPVPMVDDHITDGSKDVTFTIVDITGPVIPGSTGQSVTATIGDDTKASHEHGTDESAVLDGPVVGIINISESSNIYEGSPNGNTFNFQLTIKDPHSGEDYNGFKNDGLMSQDMTITIQTGGTAGGGDASNAGGADYHLMPSDALQALIDAGHVSVALNDDGSIKLNADGSFDLTLTGRVDANGEPHLDQDTAFNLNDLGDLQLVAVVHINGSDAGEGAETITIGIGGVSGNESQAAAGEAGNSSATIDADPVLALTMTPGSINESEPQFDLTLKFDKAIADSAEITVVLKIGGDATLWDADAATRFQSDFELANPGGTVHVTDNGDGTITVTFNGSDLNADHELNLEFPLIDDHITEGNESVTFTVDSVTLSDGTYTGGVGGSGAAAGTTITEDSISANDNGVSDIGEKDGPIFGVSIIDTNGTQTDDHNVAIQENTGSDVGSVTIGIGLTDPHTGLSYAGFESGNEMSQDTTLTITVGFTGGAGEMSYPNDFTFDFSDIKDALGLTADPVVTNDGNGNLSFTVTLPQGFDLSSASDLKFAINMVDDTFSEQAQQITVGITTDGNNESIVDGNNVTIDISEGTASGPVLSLESHPVYESAATDPPNSTADFTATHSILLSQASSELIHAKITLDGGEATRYTGDNQPTSTTWGNADYAWKGNVVVEGGARDGDTLTGGTKTEFEAGTADYWYDASTGELHVNIPVGATEVKFDVLINDDLRETSEANETYNVTLELVPGDNGLVGSEATLDGGDTSVTDTITIIDDQRPTGTGNDHFNPANFDGPYVHLSADKDTVYESTTGDHPNTVTYKVSLTDPASGGSGDAFAATEDVKVTLTLKGVTDSFHLEYGGKFQYGDLDLDVRTSGGVSTLYDANGKSVGTFVYNQATNSATIEVTVKAGQSEVDFTLKANDDPLQGSSHDVASEDYTLTITDVKGNEARVAEDDRGSITTSIKDDVAGTDGLEGIKVGLGWNSTLISGVGSDAASKYLGEGNDYTLGIKLFDKDGNALNTTNTPYKNYTGTVLPDDLAINMNLGGTSSGGDATFTLSSALQNLISLGQVSITVGGQTYVGSTGSYSASALATLANGGGLTGDITVTLIGGKFDVSNAGNLTFVTNVHGDNVNEFDHQNTYADANQADKAAETIKVEIKEVDGNESSLKTGNTVLENAITDRADGKLTLDGGKFNADTDTWSFKVAVSYTDNEYQNNPNNGSIVKLPGETVHMQIKIGDSVAMQHGQEYKVDAFSLFLSLNANDLDLAAFKLANPGVTDLASYNAWLSGHSGDLSAAAGTNGLIFVQGDDSTPSWADGSNTYDIYVPKDSWTSGGELSFTVEQGDNVGVAQGQPPFTVEIVSPAHPGGAPDFDMKGEIISVENKPVIDIPADKIILNIDGGKDIYEDAKMGDTVSTHTVSFSNGTLGTAFAEGTHAAGDISFILTLQPKSGLNFDTNLTDNYLDNYVKATGEGKGDLAVAGVGDYKDLSDLKDMLQAWLDDTNPGGGNQPGVVINNIYMEGTQVKFSITVKEGYDLSKGVSIDFKALDDSINDDGETFTLQLSGASSETNGNHGTLDLSISKDRAETTTIHDESPRGQYMEHRNGFAISLEDSVGYEASNIAGGNQYAYVTARAYILDDTSNAPTTLKNLYDAYCKYSGTADQSGGLNQAGLGALVVNDPGFKGFVDKFYGPTQGITVDYKLGSDTDTATSGQDYVNSGSHTFPSGAWELVIDADGNVYYQASGDKGLPIETIKDLISEGDETLSIAITDVNGNESRPNTTGESATVTIKDVHDGSTVIKFGPAGSLVMEPVDKEHGKDDGQDAGTQHVADPHVVNYAVQLDAAAMEDIVVWINDKSTATNGQDYTFGKNIYYADGTGKYYSMDADGDKVVLTSDQLKALFTNGVPTYLADDKAGYFVIIKEGASAIDFEIKILDDNDTVNGTALDQSGHEDIILEISGVEGSEVCAQGPGGLIPWAPDVAYTYSFTEGSTTHTGIVDPSSGTFTYKDASGTHILNFSDSGNPSWLPSTPPTASGVTNDPNLGTSVTQQTILDDMQGPMISFDAVNDRVDWTGQNIEDVEVKITMQDYCSEDVKVTINIIDAVTGESYQLTLSIPEGSLGGTYTMQELIDQNPGATLPTGDFYLQLAGSEGGETQHNSTPLFMDTDNGNSIELDNFKGNTIAEGGDSAEYTFDLSNINNTTLTDVTFDINFRPGTAGADDMTGNAFGSGKITVTISEDDLGQFVDTGTGHFVIKDDGNGPAVYWDKGDSSPPVLLPNSTVTGDLPSAVLDNVVEGNENFHAIITNPGGVDIDDGVATTVVEDQTYAKVMLFDTDGKLLDLASFPEGTELEVVAKLVQTDAAGNPIMDGNNYTFAESGTSLEFKVNYTDGSATKNADYSGDKGFVINAGESEGSFKIILNEDMITEGDETFKVDVSLSDYSKDAAASGHIIDAGKTEITITDTLNGPVIKWNVASEVAEGKSLSVNFASYIRDNPDIRQVVVQDVTLAFILTPKTGTFTVADDIKAIKIGDYTFTINPDTGDVTCNKTPPLDGSINVESNGDGTYTITATLPGGLAMGSISIEPRQDNITELDDRFTLELKEVTGSESSIATGYDGTKEVQIKDDDSGYKVGLEAVDGQESRMAGVTITFTGDNTHAPGETVKVTLTLDDNAKAILESTGEIKITLPDGTVISYTLGGSATQGIVTYDGAGKLVIDVPKENMSSAGELTVLFPIQDNSIAGTDENFTIGVSISGGEINFSNSPTYGSEFEGEYAANGKNEGGVTEFSVNLNPDSGKINAVVAEMEIKVSGASEAVVSKIIIDGVTYTKDGDTNGDHKWTLDGNSNIVIDGLGVKGSYTVDVVYKQGADQTAINQAKSDVNVTGSLTDVGHGVTVNVTDEAKVDWDGPQIAIASDGAMEGSYFTFSFDGSTLPADTATLVNGLTVNIHLDVTMPATINASGTFTASDGQNTYTCSYNSSTGVLTVYLPVGTSANDLANLKVSVPLSDNSIDATGTIAAEITEVIQDPGSSTQYEQVTFDDTKIDTSVLNSTDATGPTITLSVDTNGVEEGTPFTVTVKDTSGILAAEGTTDTKVTVTVLIENLPDGATVSGATATGQPGYYTVELTKSATSTGITITVPNNATTDVYDKIKVTIADVTDNTAYFETVKGTDTVIEVSVTDSAVVDGFDLKLTSEVTSDGIAYLVGLDAVGTYFASGHPTIEQEVSFQLNLSGMSEAQMAAVVAQLAGDHVSAVLDSGHVTVTLDSGYTHDTDLSFTVPLEVGTADHVVSIDDTSLTGNLEHLGVDASHSADYHIIAGTAGDDTLDYSAESSDHIIYGADGNDTIHGGSGNDIIYGGDGNDTIYGGDGNDIIYGGAGDDIIVGGPGDDILTGGLGSDTFKYMAGDLEGTIHGDTITDFHVGKIGTDANADVLDISDLLSGTGKDADGLISGGYLKFEAVTDDGHGNYSVKLMIDVDGDTSSSHASQVLATIHLDGYTPGSSGGDLAADLMNQLIANDQIKF